MKLKAILLLLLLPALMLLLVGCGGGPSEADINATVEVKVEQAKASLVAPTAVPLPTYTPYPTFTPAPIPTPLPTPTPQVIIKEVVVTATPTPVPTATPTPVPTATPTPINGPRCLVWEASGKVPEPTPTATSTPMPTPTHVILYPTATPVAPTPTPTTIPDPVKPISVSFELQEGWNIITIPQDYRWRYPDPTKLYGLGSLAAGRAKPVDSNPDAFFGNTNISIAMTTSGSYPVELGVPCKPEDYDTNQINKVNLTEISGDTAYWVYAKSSHQFTFDVTYLDSFSALPPYKNVHKGWNFLNVGYLVSNIYRYMDSHVDDADPQFGDTLTYEPDLNNFSWSQALEYSPATGGFITILPNTNATFTRGKAYYFLLD